MIGEAKGKKRRRKKRLAFDQKAQPRVPTCRSRGAREREREREGERRLPAAHTSRDMTRVREREREREREHTKESVTEGRRKSTQVISHSESEQTHTERVSERVREQERESAGSTCALITFSCSNRRRRCIRCCGVASLQIQQGSQGQNRKCRARVSKRATGRQYRGRERESDRTPTCVQQVRRNDNDCKHKRGRQTTHAPTDDGEADLSVSLSLTCTRRVSSVSV